MYLHVFLLVDYKQPGGMDCSLIIQFLVKSSFLQENISLREIDTKSNNFNTGILMLNLTG